MSVVPRVQVATGWGTYNALVSGGDFTGDGRPDVLARDTSGTLWRLSGTGSASRPFAARVRIGTGWQQYKHLVSPGDADGDGKADVMTTTSTGTLHFHAGTGIGTLKPRVTKATTGWSGWTDLL
jgi:hypothetical protein